MYICANVQLCLCLTFARASFSIFAVLIKSIKINECLPLNLYVNNLVTCTRTDTGTGTRTHTHSITHTHTNTQAAPSAHPTHNFLSHSRSHLNVKPQQSLEGGEWGESKNSYAHQHINGCQWFPSASSLSVFCCCNFILLLLFFSFFMLSNFNYKVVCCRLSC